MVLTTRQANSASNTANLKKYLDLDQKGSIIAEYVWIDGAGGCRSKCKTINKPITSVDDLPEWNFDGSSTGQAPGDNSDVYLRPVAYYPDPFRLGDNVLVMCETWMSDATPNKFNYRHDSAVLMDANASHEFWFGLEQEYTLLDPSGWPLGWPTNGYPAPQGPYYCGVGAGKVFGRDIVDAHYKACLYASIQISGTNAEVMPGQWEYQIGPCVGISQGDQLWMSRFILHRVAEEFGVKVTFAPKPVPGDWNGAGLHTNVSTKEMREEGGIKAIEAAMEKLSTRHAEHMEVYGEDNQLRMTGAHETASYDKFSWGVANRGASVRVNRAVAEEGKGYFEDRRPASNADPYQITGIIVQTLCGNVEGVNIGKAVSVASSTPDAVVETTKS
ncbi:glutamine synthetase [Eremomyces bilateralis CBS 781.70]|uniref:Glutamine synthetase n=1 Tax=Eremomyces bilateralis CBS 781.70 TaxID=1392243 RepID=A0A6G1G322_9PEZI|nr:glutamine synthetase [Eremomyces bilateralis CBS 781.70]KAF1812320.1 glutamine synthetase [Eremomyces bilateralis CBS 781.70]